MTPPVDLDRPPRFADISVLLGDATRGDGMTLQLAPVVRRHDEDLAFAAALIRSGRPIPAGFRPFVPDLRQVAAGPGRRLPREEADRLVEAWYYGHRPGEAHLVRDHSDPLPERDGYPGAVFRPGG